jgi:hypothetical protein
MSATLTHTISACLIGGGALAWALVGQPLVENPELAVPLNPLGINGSPYGEVFAMAMQGPIDTYFHGAMASGAAHQHPPGVSCPTCDAAKVKLAAAKSTPSLEARFQGLLTSLDEAQALRTNPRAANDAHKRYLRRQVEDKLRFAYQLDPAHYANYNSLHFFLTEPALGTRPELTPSAALLAEQTIAYCLKQQHDPRPMLTACGACTNVLQLMFADHNTPTPTFTTAQMRGYVTLLDHCIGRYVAEAQAWDVSKNWELLSPQRIIECDERFDFIKKIREASDKTILRYETDKAPQAPN